MVTNADIMYQQIIKDNYAALKEMINKPQVENQWIDFKRKTEVDGSRQLTRDDKNNFAKALSGFANATGGLLIWGVDARIGDDKNLICEETPITNLSSFHQQLESLLPVAVIRIPDGVQITRVTKPNKEDEGFLVVFVPESINAPHRAEFNLKKYYRRIGDSFLVMDHSQIEDLFGRRQRPKLELEVSYKSLEISFDKHQYELILNLSNTGRVMCKNYGFDLFFPKIAFGEIKLGGRPEFSAPRPAFTGRLLKHNNEELLDDVRISYRSGKEEPPIFPGERGNIAFKAGRIFYNIDNESYNQLGGVKVKANIYADNAPKYTKTIPFDQLHMF